MQNPLPLVIIGTGLAGYTLAKEFRKLNAERPLILITQDDGRFYTKPQLSESLSKDKTADDLARFDAEQMQAQLNADIYTHTKVHRIDPETQCLHLDDVTLAYGDLVLATGARPNTLEVPPEVSDAVFYLNNLSDYERLQKALQPNTRVAIIGAGLIGCELANDFANQGIQPLVISNRPTPMDGLLPEPFGHGLQTALEALGVCFHFNTLVQTLQTSSTGILLSLSDNRQLEVDRVLIAIGLAPNTDLAHQAGLEIGQGIQTDCLLRSSQPHIYALGDCAEIEGQNRMYLAPIIACAKALAKTLNGTPTPVEFPIMPVTIKTPAYPIAYLQPENPDSPAEHNWQLTQDEDGIQALCYDAETNLIGYVLSGQHAAKKRQFNALIQA